MSSTVQMTPPHVGEARYRGGWAEVGGTVGGYRGGDLLTTHKDQGQEGPRRVDRPNLRLRGRPGWGPRHRRVELETTLGGRK